MLITRFEGSGIKAAPIAFVTTLPLLTVRAAGPWTAAQDLLLPDINIK